MQLGRRVVLCGPNATIWRLYPIFLQSGLRKPYTYGRPIPFPTQRSSPGSAAGHIYQTFTGSWGWGVGGLASCVNPTSQTRRVRRHQDRTVDRGSRAQELVAGRQAGESYLLVCYSTWVAAQLRFPWVPGTADIGSATGPEIPDTRGWPIDAEGREHPLPVFWGVRQSRRRAGRRFCPGAIFT